MQNVTVKQNKKTEDNPEETYNLGLKKMTTEEIATLVQILANVPTDNGSTHGELSKALIRQITAAGIAKGIMPIPSEVKPSSAILADA